MNKHLIKIFIVIACIAVFMPQSFAKKKNVIRTVGGAVADQLGVVIDASYDKRLDTFLPGYKVINVALANQALNVLRLNPNRDKWSIKLVGESKPFKAIYDLRSQDSKAWAALPERAKGLIGYPLVLPIGARQVIDIFVPETVDVEKFNELDIYFDSIDTQVEIFVGQ